MRLQGKTAIIAGVGPDVGRLSALSFAREGAAVALIARTAPRLETIAAEIQAAGGAALPLPGDITVEEDVRLAVQKTVERFGRVDVLLNNATFSGDLVDFTQMTRNAWDSVLLGALTGFMFTAREVARIMTAQQSGSIIQVSSGAGSVGFSRRAHYSVAKAGVNNLTHTLSWELGRHGVRINTIVLGAVMTESWLAGAQEQERTGGISVEERERRWARRSPISRMVRPQEVADLALYLASDESASMTGQCINLTAGVVQS